MKPPVAIINKRCIIKRDLNHTMNHIYSLLTSKEKKLCEIHRYKKDQILFHEDDYCEYVGIVNKGLITISSYSLNGTEIIYNNLHEGEIFGNNLIFASSPYYRGNVVAKNNSEVVLINKKNLLHILQTNQLFLEKYLTLQSDFGLKINAKLKTLSFSSAEERLLYHLQLNNGHITYSSITSLAALLFLQRETLSRLLSSLEKRNVIRKKDKELFLIK